MYLSFIASILTFAALVLSLHSVYQLWLRRAGLTLSSGLLSIQHQPYDHPPSLYGFRSISPGRRTFQWKPGVGWSHVESGTIYWFHIPLWIPIACMMGLGAFLKRSLRLMPGHCKVCEYSLVGLTSGYCPECGNQVSVN